MPAKYSHVKKRPTNAQQRKSNSKANNTAQSPFHGHAHRNPNPHLDRTITQAMTAVSELERAISRILLLRYEQDIGRLYSTRLHNIAMIYLPKLMLDCINLSSPGWIAVNADCDEIKDFLRSAIAMDMRQAGERVATKSVLWSYTALRHFVSAFPSHFRSSTDQTSRPCQMGFQYARNVASTLYASCLTSLHSRHTLTSSKPCLLRVLRNPRSFHRLMRAWTCSKMICHARVGKADSHGSTGG